MYPRIPYMVYRLVQKKTMTSVEECKIWPSARQWLALTVILHEISHYQHADACEEST